MSATLPIRRVRDGAEIEDLCEGHQPEALLVSSPVNEAMAGRRARCWVVGPAGDEVGVLTTVAVAPGLVSASALLLDPGSAPTLAELVRRSRATVLAGGADHVGPIAALIPGARPHPLELLGMELPEVDPVRDRDPHRHEWQRWVRTAQIEDVPALVALYERFPLEFLGPKRLAPALDGLVRQHRILVLEVDGQVVGAQRVEARSRHWAINGGLTLLPEHRGQGLSRWFEGCTRQLSRVEGRAFAGIRAVTNQVPHEHEGMIVRPWLEVRLPTAPSVPRRARRWVRRQVRSRSSRSTELR